MHARAGVAEFAPSRIVSAPAWQPLDRLYVGFLKVFVWSNVWIAAGLASLTLFTAHVLGLAAEPGPPALVFASGLFIYTLDHVRDAAAGEVADHRLAAYFRHPVQRLLLAAYVVASLALVVFAPSAVWAVFGAYFLVGLLYGAPVLPVRRAGRWVKIRIKEVAGLKSWLVGGTMTFAAVGIPLAWAGVLPTPAAWKVVLFLFVFCASNAHMFDVRDIESDRATGVSSHPVRLGERHTRLMLVLLNLVMLGTMMWGWASGVTEAHPEILVATAATVLYVLLVSSQSPRGVFDVVVDGCFYLPAFLGTIHDVLT